MLRALLHFIIHGVAFETTDLALLRIRATGAMPMHDIRGRPRAMHTPRPHRR